MAFGDTYGYKTNASVVVAFAEGDERTVTVEGGTNYNVVDLVLTGQGSGTARRYDVRVATEANAETNQAFAVSDD